MTKNCEMNCTSCLAAYWLSKPYVRTCLVGGTTAAGSTMKNQHRTVSAFCRAQEDCCVPRSQMRNARRSFTYCSSAYARSAASMLAL